MSQWSHCWRWQRKIHLGRRQFVGRAVCFHKQAIEAHLLNPWPNHRTTNGIHGTLTVFGGRWPILKAFHFRNRHNLIVIYSAMQACGFLENALFTLFNLWRRFEQDCHPTSRNGRGLRIRDKVIQIILQLHNDGPSSNWWNAPTLGTTDSRCTFRP